jgi:uncharacterized protein YfiM (DUF2279 family)
MEPKAHGYAECSFLKSTQHACKKNLSAQGASNTQTKDIREPRKVFVQLMFCQTLGSVTFFPHGT